MLDFPLKEQKTKMSHKVYHFIHLPGLRENKLPWFQVCNPQVIMKNKNFFVCSSYARGSLHQSHLYLNIFRIAISSDVASLLSSPVTSITVLLSYLCL